MSKGRIVDRSLVAKFLAEKHEISSIRRVAERNTVWMLVIDRKDEIAAITATGRKRRRRADRVKIINPFETLTEPSTGSNPLGDPGIREAIRPSEDKD